MDSRTNLTCANGRLPLVGCTTSAFDVKNLHTSGLNAEVVCPTSGSLPFGLVR